MRRDCSRPGFTLIELLVVIAVIALLAAILFPVFAQARQKAYQATCTSNLHQIGLALALYQDDNDERLMPGHHLATPSPANGTDYGGWAGLCNVYARAPHLFRCPTDDTPDTTVASETFYALTYFLNQNLACANAPQGLPRSAFALPAVTVVISEETAGLFHDTARLQDPDETDSTFANYFAGTAATQNRHQGGRMFLLEDGHVRWLRPERVSTGNMVSDGTVVSLPPYAAPPGQLGAAFDATFAYR